MKKTAGFILLAILINSCASVQTKNEEKMSKKIIIEAWSDLVCPFCFIGKKKIERAVAKLNAQDKVELVWRSFQLDPTFPNDQSMNASEYLSQKKGFPMDQVKAMQQQLVSKGVSEGIDFRFEKAMSFNTFKVHRLMQWGKTIQKGNQLKEAFMLAYFTKGIDLSKEENILEIVAQVGANKEEAQRVLLSTDFTKEVLDDIEKARSIGVRGVPYFLINGTDVISGAQEDKVFEKVVSAALKNIPQEKHKGDNPVCLPSGACE